MSKTIELNKTIDSEANHWIVVSDTVNGKTIDEIWCTSTGEPIFVIGGVHHNWKELLKILPKPEEKVA